MSALSAVLSTRVGRRGKFGDVSWRECTGQGNDFELIATVKIKTRNSEDGYFGSDL